MIQRCNNWHSLCVAAHHLLLCNTCLPTALHHEPAGSRRLRPPPPTPCRRLSACPAAVGMCCPLHEAVMFLKGCSVGRRPPATLSVRPDKQKPHGWGFTALALWLGSSPLETPVFEVERDNTCIHGSRQQKDGTRQGKAAPWPTDGGGENSPPFILPKPLFAL